MRADERERVVFCALFGKCAPLRPRTLCLGLRVRVRTEQAEQLMLWVQHIRGHPTPQVAQDHLFWIDARLPFPLRVWNLPFASRRRLPAQRAQG